MGMAMTAKLVQSYNLNEMFPGARKVFKQRGRKANRQLARVTVRSELDAMLQEQSDQASQDRQSDFQQLEDQYLGVDSCGDPHCRFCGDGLIEDHDDWIQNSLDRTARLLDDPWSLTTEEYLDESDGRPFW